jgi:Flp pilus assembly protein TadG
MVEIVLALPLLLLVLIVVLQFGMVMRDYVEVSQAARAGARTASVSRKADSPAGAAVAAARGSASSLDDDALDVDVTPGGAWRKGDPVSVRVAYPFKVTFLGLFDKVGTLSFEATSRVQ